MAADDQKTTDTIPRASVEQILSTLALIASVEKSHFEAIRKYLYSQSGRRSPASSTASWTVARDVLTELQRLSLATVGVLPRRRSDIERLRESPCEVTQAGRDLAKVYASRKGQAYDSLLLSWLASHPYFRAFVYRVAAAPLYVPDVTSTSQIGGSRSPDDVSANVLRNCEERLTRVGFDGAKLTGFTQALRRRFGDVAAQLSSPDLDTKKLVDLVQDSVVIPAFLESEQLPFDGVTFHHVMKISGEFFAAASTTAHPDFSGRVVFSTCDFVPSEFANPNTEVTAVNHHGGAFARPDFAGALTAAYSRLAGSVGGYVDAYVLRAVVCLQLRIQPPVFASCLKEIIAAGEAAEPVVYTELPFTPPPQGEAYVEVGGRRIGKIKIKSSRGA